MKKRKVIVFVIFIFAITPVTLLVNYGVKSVDRHYYMKVIEDINKCRREGMSVKIHYTCAECVEKE